MKTAIDQSKLVGLEYARGSTIAHEGVYLSELVELFRPTTVVEIGSWIGVSTIYLARAVKELGRGTVYAIDPHKDSVLHRRRNLPSTLNLFYENLMNYGVDDVVKGYVGTSMQVLANWKIPIDFLFIDGNHLFKFVRQDFFGFSPWIPSGEF